MSARTCPLKRSFPETSHDPQPGDSGPPIDLASGPSRRLGPARHRRGGGPGWRPLGRGAHLSRPRARPRRYAGQGHRLLGTVPARGRSGGAQGPRLLGRRRSGRHVGGCLPGPLLSDKARTLGPGRGPRRRQGTRRPAPGGLRHRDALGPPRLLGDRPRQPRPPLVHEVRWHAPVHHRQHPLQLPFGLPGRRPSQRQRHCAGCGPQRRVLQEAAIRPPGRPLPAPDGETLSRRRGPPDRRRRLLPSPEPGLVPRPGRRGGEDGVRARPDRRSDSLRPRHGGVPLDAPGGTQRRRPDAVSEVHRRPIRWLSERLALPGQ